MNEYRQTNKTRNIYIYFLFCGFECQENEKRKSFSHFHYILEFKIY